MFDQAHPGACGGCLFSIWNFGRRFVNDVHKVVDAVSKERVSAMWSVLLLEV